MKENGQPDPRTIIAANLQDAQFRIPFFAVVSWAALVVLSVVLTLAVRIDLYSLLYGTASAGILFGAWVPGRKLFLDKKTSSFLPFRKYAGYMGVLLYILHAVPRLSWQSNGIIGPGTALYLFIISIVFTIASIILFLSLRNLKTQVYWGVISEKESKDKKLRKKAMAGREMTPFEKAFDWVDAFLQAAILVVLINTFAIQIYAIPSESMVPTFLKYDRPLTIKFLSGPAFPFTEYQLPVLKHPSRGDVIVLRNPRYDEDRDILKQQVSKLVFMLTFSLVNPDRYDEYGQEKPDPLVKRIIGLPGEKIMMRDDKVYVKTSADTEFRHLESMQQYAQADIYTYAAELKARMIERAPITVNDRQLFTTIDTKKNEADIDAFRKSIPELFSRLEARVRGLDASTIERFGRDVLRKQYPNPARALTQAVSEIKRNTNNIFTDPSAHANELLHLYGLLSGKDGIEDLRKYALSWLAAGTDGSLHERDRRVLSLYLKENLLRLFLRDLELIADGVMYEAFTADQERRDLLQEFENIATYALIWFDWRNLKEFPEGEGNYIPEGFYFPMGDNRYNSIDFRNRSDSRRRPFDPSDPASIEYNSLLDTRLLPEKNIEGYAVWKVWPFRRFGPVQ